LRSADRHYRVAGLEQQVDQPPVGTGKSAGSPILSSFLISPAIPSAMCSTEGGDRLSGLLEHPDRMRSAAQSMPM
jgi:hypothetical protein